MTRPGFLRKKVRTSLTSAHQVGGELLFCRVLNGSFASMLSFFEVRVRFDPTEDRINRFSATVPCVSQKTARLLNKKTCREGSIQVSVLSASNRSLSVISSRL